jgi:arginine repressor
MMNNIRSWRFSARKTGKRFVKTDEKIYTVVNLVYIGFGMIPGIFLERKCELRRKNKMSNDQTGPNSMKEAVKAGILELFAEQEEYRSQQEIIDVLKKKGITASQVTVSRALKDLKIERNENGFWVLGRKGEYKQQLKALEGLFEKAGGSPRLYSHVETVILRTEPNYNVLLAQQIEETFEYEVLSTFCPNETDIVIYYRLRKKDTKDINDTQDTQEPSMKDTESAEAENPIVTEDLYKKSRMRIEIVKLCRKMREKK